MGCWQRDSRLGKLRQEPARAATRKATTTSLSVLSEASPDSYANIVCWGSRTTRLWRCLRSERATARREWHLVRTRARSISPDGRCRACSDCCVSQLLCSFDCRHVFEDAVGWWQSTRGWTHWRSRDLIHWVGNFSNGLDFGKAMTGSVSPTPSGVYAFWPDGDNAIFSAKSMDPAAGLLLWERRNETIAEPSRVGKWSSRSTGFRDPA
eukprot:SAG31_NODE_7145_length_1777_cov_1.325983_2_plen_209_part_00